MIVVGGKMYLQASADKVDQSPDYSKVTITTFRTISVIKKKKKFKPKYPIAVTLHNNGNSPVKTGRKKYVGYIGKAFAFTYRYLEHL